MESARSDSTQKKNSSPDHPPIWEMAYVIQSVVSTRHPLYADFVTCNFAVCRRFEPN